MESLISVLRAVGIAALLLFVRAESPEADDASGDESFYQQIARCVIRLENPGTGKPVGSAFFITYSEDRRHYYLITARHVVEPGLGLLARVPSQHRETGETQIVELRLPASIWIHHPSRRRTVDIRGQPEELLPVDVAVAKVGRIKDRRVRTVGYCPDPPCSGGFENQFLDTDPMPPLRILVWGFPRDLGFTLEEQRPMGRIGLVAMVARQPFIRMGRGLRDERVLLLDAPIFPGNSGSPIFSHPPLGEPRLAGLVSASNSSLSYAIAEPISRIEEAIEHAQETEISTRAVWHLLPSPVHPPQPND